VIKFALPCTVQSYDIKLPVTNLLMINCDLPVLAVAHLGRDVKTIEIIAYDRGASNPLIYVN
jgi:hypothetical protein